MRRLFLFLCLFLFFLTGCTPTALPATPASSSPTLTSPSQPAVSSTALPNPTNLQSQITPAPLRPNPTALPSSVIIISIDGLRPDALLQANTPNIKALAERGAYTWKAQTVDPSVTLPAHASMLTGYLPEIHGMTWNDYKPERGLITVPTIFSLAHIAGLRTVMIVGKEKFAHLNQPGSADAYLFVRGGDQDVADQAIVQIKAGFDLMFVHLPDTDGSGHSSGWMSEKQIAGLARTDEAIGRLLAALPANTTILLTADHGGRGESHSADIPENRTIPWIIAGPSIMTNHPITFPVNIVDTAATALYALGLPLPADLAGRPVYEAFGQLPPDLRHGRWSEGAAQTPARSEMPAAVFNDLIYVPGGFGGGRVFQAYDPAANRWIDLAPLPGVRHHLMAAALNGKVYIFGGGAAGTWNPSSTAHAYDPAANAWAELAPMPEARMSGAAVALDERIYIVGGAGGTQALLEYDPNANAWRSLATLSTPREHLAAVALDGEIYALGGRWGGLGEFSSIEIYNPANDAWRAGPRMLQPRAGFSAAVLRGCILATGGEIILNGRETLATFEIFEPGTQAWSPAPPLRHPIHGVAAAVVGDRFYLLGGSSRAGAIENEGRLMIYNP